MWICVYQHILGILFLDGEGPTSLEQGHRVNEGAQPHHCLNLQAVF